MDDVQMTEIVVGGPSGTAEVSENMNFVVANVEGCYKAYNDITPYVGFEFNSIDEAFDYYNLYAKDKRFGIRKEGLDKSRKLMKEVLSRIFACNKAGVKRVDKREFGKHVNHRPNTRVNCTARMKIKLTDSNTWVVLKFTEEHKNHSLTSPDKVLNHYSHKRMHRTQSCKNLMSKLSGQGLPPSTIAHVLNAAGGSGDELITSQQCTDHIRTIRKNNIGIECILVIKNFQDRRAIDPDFYFAMEVYNDGIMRSTFWADGRSRSTYLRLGDVVFDVTYRTNYLNLPFAPFTGVNHHRQSILFECALLADEQEDTFVWLLLCGYLLIGF